MSRSSSHDHLLETEFNNRIREFLADAYQACLSGYRGFVIYEMYSQYVYLKYLDLAFQSPLCVPWQTFVKTVFNEYLPVLGREYNLAERNYEGHALKRLYLNVFGDFTQHIISFQVARDKENIVYLQRFRDQIFNGIWTRGNNERKVITLRYLNACNVLQHNLFYEMYGDLLRLCTNPPLDSELTVHVFRTMCNLNITRRIALEFAPDYWSLEVLIRHAKEMRFDFWGMWTGNGVLAYPFHFFRESENEPILNQESRRLLLRYGFPYLENLNEYNRRLRWLERQKVDDVFLVRTLDPLLEEEQHGGVMKFTLMMDIFIIFGNLDGSEDQDTKIQTLLYITRTVPNPYVTPSELYRTMLMLIEPQFIPDLGILADNYATADIFDGEYENHSPRKLNHLCRVVIRKRLTVNFNLPEGIQVLPLPSDVKSYLALDI